MLHPCFCNKRTERDQPGNNLLAAAYFQARSISQNFQVDGLQSPAPITAWLRPLEYYTNALRESGFVITSLSEPHPSERLLRSDDWWRTSLPRPLFMLIVARRWPR